MRNHQLESRVRENRTHGSEGGEGECPSLPLSSVGIRQKRFFHILSVVLGTKARTSKLNCLNVPDLSLPHQVNKNHKLDSAANPGYRKSPVVR